jgi:2-methylcitrate dehydratase PrpD
MSGQNTSPHHAARRFAAHAVDATAALLPDSAVAAVKAFTLDTVGVGIGGAGSRYARALAQTVRGWGEGVGAANWFDGARLPAPHAAFVNAFLAHCQEFDCVHEGAVLHPFTVVTPVLLAEADARGMSGADYIAACAAGVDVAAGLGIAAKSQIQFFRPATCGLFGAVAALCRARGLDAETATHAFGYALAFASGTMQAHTEGTPALAAQVAGAARSAFHAVDLAQAGLPGPVGAIDGPFGYLSLFERESDVAPVLESLGRVWRVCEVSWKPYPTGRAAHGGIDMMRAALRDGVSPRDIASVAFHVPPLIMHLVGRPIVRPLEVNYARLCLPYAAATALMDGTVTLSHFSSDALDGEDVHALARRITVHEVANPDAAAFVPQRATIRLRDGGERTYRVDVLPGSVARPLSRDEQIEKASACMTFGGRGAVTTALVEAVDSLAACPDVGRINRIAAGDAG